MREIKVACNVENHHLTVSFFDIKNAFSAVYWTEINEPMNEHAFPMDLCLAIQSYIQRRYLLSVNDSAVRRKQVVCGIPRGSVLGSIL